MSSGAERAALCPQRLNSKSPPKDIDGVLSNFVREKKTFFFHGLKGFVFRAIFFFMQWLCARQ